MESWRELWLFRANAGGWTIDVLSPGADDPEEGYVEYAGFVPGARRLLIAREVRDHGRFRRRFEELRLDDLALVRQAMRRNCCPNLAAGRTLIGDATRSRCIEASRRSEAAVRNRLTLPRLIPSECITGICCSRTRRLQRCCRLDRERKQRSSRASSRGSRGQPRHPCTRSCQLPRLPVGKSARPGSPAE